jgi:pimeloyl-ACP methyl ester carboxylesterase
MTPSQKVRCHEREHGLPAALAAARRTIALHCSGAGAREWRFLTEALAPDCELLAPEHFGCQSSGPWSGEHAFSLVDEAARTIALIDRCEAKIHLVGHSYGGGVALHVALAGPDRVAGMALYEPSAFHLLPQMGERGREAYAEISRVARHLRESIVIGDYRSGVAAFVDYWNEPGAWNAMRPEAQRALTSWAPKGVLEFRALFSEATSTRNYLDLEFPVRRRFWTFLHSLYARARLNGNSELSRRINIVGHSRRAEIAPLHEVSWMRPRVPPLRPCNRVGHAAKPKADWSGRNDQSVRRLLENYRNDPESVEHRAASGKRRKTLAGWVR